MHQGETAVGKTKRKAGVMLPAWIHPLVATIAKMTDVEVGAIYTDAMLEWLRKQHIDGRGTVKSHLSAAAQEIPELKEALYIKTLPLRKHRSG